MSSYEQFEPEMVPLNAVRIDGGTQARTTIDEAVVAEYREALRAGAALPPVMLFFDGVHIWLADGFHRYHACAANDSDEILAIIRTGSRRDAVLYAVGANAGHGLRRTNADKRRAVQMLLEDAEWMTWSDYQVAKACAVSHEFVRQQRASLATVASDEPAERTYTTKHGTKARMKTAKIGKGKAAANSTKPAVPAVESAPHDTPVDTPTAEGKTVANSATNPAAPAVENAVNATPNTPDPATAAELAALREQVAELQQALAAALADNEVMGRVVDADDQIKAALDEVKRHRALAENAERTLAARSHEFVERARNVVYWKNRAEKAERLLDKAA